MAMSKKLKKIFQIVLIFIILLFLIFLIRGSDDTWICKNGEWIKHGNPSELKPEIPCKVGDDDQIVDEENISQEKIVINVYFNNTNFDDEMFCNKVFPIKREINKTQAVARAALLELFKGPTQKEKEQGYFTNINNGVEIQSLTIKNGIAYVDFNEQLQYQVGGSCRVAAIRAEIAETLKQFPSIAEVVISIVYKNIINLINAYEKFQIAFNCFSCFRPFASGDFSATKRTARTTSRYS